MFPSASKFVSHYGLNWIAWVVRRIAKVICPPRSQKPKIPIPSTVLAFAGECEIPEMLIILIIVFVICSVRNLLLHSWHHFLPFSIWCQKLMHSIAEASRTSQFHGSLNFPKEFLSYNFQATEQYRVAWGWCKEPRLDLLNTSESDRSSFLFSQATCSFIAHNHASIFGDRKLCNGLHTFDIEVCIVASLIPQYKVSENICTLN